jgi:hypothetical protein
MFIEREGTEAAPEIPQGWDVYRREVAMSFRNP